MRRRHLLASLALPPALAQAQTVIRDVRLIVPFAPGGTVDMLARLLAEALTPDLGGRAVVVENRSGAGTFIAMQLVASAPPDGHLLSIAANTVLATAPVLPGANPPIDLDRSLAPVSNLIRVPIVLVGRPQAPYATLDQLIAYARANPGRLNIGQSGTGSLTQMLAIRLMHETGTRMEQIQYRGGTPALTDMLAGNNDLYFSLLTESLSFIREGRLRPIAFASEQRNPTLPDVPLMQDTLPGFVGDVAYGLVASAETAAEWVAFWNARFNAVMNRPEFRQRLRDLQMLPINGSAEAYRSEIQRDRTTWSKLIRDTGMRGGD
jgi:tripartite-type tricarboxylate transporter receptor subunit TctC